jgi:DNA-directed RNA polymerase subunit RPC12/RpoP
VRLMIQTQSKDYKCIHCGKSFLKEKTLMAHMCEPKRRHLQKDEKRVQVGFMTFNKFYTQVQKSKEKTYAEFCKSSYYNAFVKFGSFVTNVQCLYREKFIDFVIKSGVKLDHWCRDELYDTYLFEMLKIEPVESAVQRSIQTMMDWGDKQEAPYNDYFRFVNLNRAVNDIRTGRISPWLLLNSSAGHKLVESLNDEQIQIVEPTLDIMHWRKTFANKPADVKLVKEIIKEANIA